MGAVSDPCTHKVRAVDNSISESFASILFVTVTLVITFGPNCSSAAENKYLASSFMPVNANRNAMKNVGFQLDDVIGSAKQITLVMSIN